MTNINYYLDYMSDWTKVDLLNSKTADSVDVKDIIEALQNGNELAKIVDRILYDNLWHYYGDIQGLVDSLSNAQVNLPDDADPILFKKLIVAIKNLKECIKGVDGGDDL